VLPSGSILSTTATQLHINLSTAAENEKLSVYKTTTDSMINMLYETSLNEIPKAAIEMLEKDIREMISGLRSANSKGIDQIRSYLEKAQVKSTLALSMFDRKEEEMSKTRLENRYEALLECRAKLENARDYLAPLIST